MNVTMLNVNLTELQVMLVKEDEYSLEDIIARLSIQPEEKNPLTSLQTIF